MSIRRVIDLTHIDLESPTGELELFVAEVAVDATLEAEMAAMMRIVDDFNVWIEDSLDAACRAHYDAGYDPWVLRWATSQMLAETASRVDPGPSKAADEGASSQ